MTAVAAQNVALIALPALVAYICITEAIDRHRRPNDKEEANDATHT